MIFLQSLCSLIYLIYGSKEFTSIPQVMPVIYAKQWTIKDLLENQHLTNDNMINTVMQCINHILLNAYSMTQKSLYQNFTNWGAHIQDSAWKC